ncbi:MAG: hypothetical protein JWM52_371 [Candidatus Saccharibacteria bacterium]|nr:hypothetical protein [Candidatus Saccharibacteria bacterium]
MTENERLAVHPNIYMERAGKGSRELAEKLVEAPTDPLEYKDKVAALAFEREICDFMVDDEMTLKDMLKLHKGEAIDAPAFFAEAVMRNEVHIPGLEGPLLQLTTPQEVYSWVAQAAQSNGDGIDAKILREIAKQTVAYYTDGMTETVLRDDEPSPLFTDHMSIVLDPEKTLRFARAEERAREYLVELRKEYPVGSTGLDGAKRSFVDIYLKRINGIVAADIPVMEYLMDQSKLIGDQETYDAAEMVVPEGLHEAARTAEKRTRLYKRLDYIKNGIGYDDDGHASAVDDEVIVEPIKNFESDTPPLFSPEQRKILEETMLTGDESMALFQAILSQSELLSSEDSSTWFPGRGKRAVDGLFQVVVNPTKEGFAVDGIEGVLMIPGKGSSLYQILTVAIHELEHINQAQADEKLSKIIKIGEVKGRRVSMLKETGANISQRKAEKELFGTSKPVALTYARAIQAFEKGESITDATKAFFKEKTETFPNMGAATAAKEAAGRVLRLILSGGTNSQPMSYAEENIMNEELANASPEVRRRATMITTIDLDDQERLHRFGLLPELGDDSVDWLSIVFEKAKPFIDKALSAE